LGQRGGILAARKQRTCECDTRNRSNRNGLAIHILYKACGERAQAQAGTLFRTAWVWWFSKACRPPSVCVLDDRPNCRPASLREEVARD
jgi:hypothetical protein